LPKPLDYLAQKLISFNIWLKKVLWGATEKNLGENPLQEFSSKSLLCVFSARKNAKAKRRHSMTQDFPDTFISIEKLRVLL
tara:strand:+ start:953 stop:1195 length:243 start_codon:yes stop_codon:yes gene_type:complete